MKKQHIFIITGLLLWTSHFGQSVHEFTLQGTVGISELRYDVNAGERKTGFGGSIGLGYTFFISPHWGIGTGADIAFINAKYELPQFQSAYMTHDGTEDFEFRYAMNGYTEKQRAVNINIPLLLKFQTNGDIKFYAAAGAKFGFPVRATYKSKAEEFTTSGYYPQYRNELSGPAFMGFGQFRGEERKDDLNLKTMVMLSAEAGVKWKLAEKWSLYTGAFIDYGLNDIRDETPDKPLLIYNSQSPADFRYHSVTASRLTTDEPFTGKIRLFAAGIKVAVAFGKTPKKEKIIQTVPPAMTERGAGSDADEAARQNALREAEEKRLAEQEKQRKEAEAAEAARLREEKTQYDQAVKVVEEKISGYEIGQTELSPAKKAELDQKAALLKKYPDLKILCIGHTCDTGTGKVNRRIGLERAQAAKDYLVNQDIDADRIQTFSKSSSEPLVPNTSEENRRINRRVEIVVNN